MQCHPPNRVPCVPGERGDCRSRYFRSPCWPVSTNFCGFILRCETYALNRLETGPGRYPCWDASNADRAGGNRVLKCNRWECSGIEGVPDGDAIVTGGGSET